MTKKDRITITKLGKLVGNLVCKGSIISAQAVLAITAVDGIGTGILKAREALETDKATTKPVSHPTAKRGRPPKPMIERVYTLKEKGLENSEIARRLNISLRSVAAYKANITRNHA